jgi:hypothetical protein
MMQWVSLGLFVARMIAKYGPALWKLAKQIFDDIEDRRNKDGKPLDRNEKAMTFNTSMVKPYTELKGRVPDTAYLNGLRENVWKAKNPGAKPKKLRSSKLRKTGKTKWKK